MGEVDPCFVWNKIAQVSDPALFVLMEMKPIAKGDTRRFSKNQLTRPKFKFVLGPKKLSIDDVLRELDNNDLAGARGSIVQSSKEGDVVRHYLDKFGTRLRLNLGVKAPRHKSIEFIFLLKDSVRNECAKKLGVSDHQPAP